MVHPADFSIIFWPKKEVKLVKSAHAIETDFGTVENMATDVCHTKGGKGSGGVVNVHALVAPLNAPAGQSVDTFLCIGTDLHSIVC